MTNFSINPVSGENFHLDLFGYFFCIVLFFVFFFCFFFFTLFLDIDECSSNDNECVKGGANCTNTEGSYKCTCQFGHFWDGTKCEGLLHFASMKSSRSKRQLF